MERSIFNNNIYEGRRSPIDWNGINEQYLNQLIFIDKEKLINNDKLNNNNKFKLPNYNEIH